MFKISATIFKTDYLIENNGQDGKAALRPVVF